MRSIEPIEWLLIAILLAMFATEFSKADDYSVRLGPGVINSRLSGKSKAFGLRRESELELGFADAYEVGGYTDSRDDHKAAAMVKAQLGVRPGMEEGLFGKAFVGPCLISVRDKALGGYFQFCEDVGVGIRDQQTFIDVDYQHISSAGLESPNMGRDNIVFEAGMRFQ